MGILGVKFHELVEEDMGYWGHSHGCAWMPGVGFTRHIDCQAADCVDAFPIEARVRG